MRRVVDSSSEPGGVLLVACRNRRATVCPACSKVYRGDAWHLISAGLRGGKGVAAAVGSRPRVFVTLTAPSFGPVHSQRRRSGRARTCRPRRSDVCPHGVSQVCRKRHLTGDPLLGQPLCGDCFTYDEAVLWNAHAGALWNRTAIGLRRALARRAGVAVRRLPDIARVSFVKVVEYQARGVIHLHAVVRLDGPDDAGQPPRSLDVDAVALIVQDAVRAARVPVVLPDGSASTVGWGEQIDVRRISSDAEHSGAVAAYIAKYATKSTDAIGALDHRIRCHAEIDRLAVNPHLRRLVRTCWDLGGHPRYRRLRLRAWAHTLGYRGHWTTKSRAYSTTFSALRSARAEHREAAGDDVRLGAWSYAGRGYGLVRV